MRVGMYIFRTFGRASYCVNHFVFVFVFSVVVAVIVLQFYICVANVVGYIFRWHFQFVSIVVGVELCRLNVLAKLIWLVSFYVGFGVLLTQLSVWQLCGVGVVSARCVLFLLSVIATMVCIYFYRCGVAFLFHRNQFLI